jgi:arginyl-tRNA synthetase
MHVIRCLWCFERFHRNEKDRVPVEARQRWLGDLYTEAVQRLEYRDQVVGLLNELSKMDAGFTAMIDRMSKELYKVGAPGEDVAYLLGQIANQREIRTDAIYDDATIARFWPIVGRQLEDELELIRREGPQQAGAAGAVALRWPAGDSAAGDAGGHRGAVRALAAAGRTPALVAACTALAAGGA